MHTKNITKLLYFSLIIFEFSIALILVLDYIFQFFQDTKSNIMFLILIIDLLALTLYGEKLREAENK